VREWVELKRFFDNVAHHQLEPTDEEFRDRMRCLEVFTLKKLNPRTFADFDDIDALISEGETK